MTKIKTTHVGSLPRSDELSDLLFKKDKKEKIDLDNFDAVVKKDVKKIVKKQNSCSGCPGVGDQPVCYSRVTGSWSAVDDARYRCKGTAGHL